MSEVIPIASDHAGFEMKEQLEGWPREHGYEVILDVFLNTGFEGGRHVRRVEKIEREGSTA